MKTGLFIPVLLLTVSCAEKSSQEADKPVPSKQAITITEDSLKKFIAGSYNVPLQVAQKKLELLMAGVQNDSLRFRDITAFFSKHFSDPNSIYRNEDLYIQVLQSQLQSAWYINAEKDAAKSKLRLALQNRVGSAANDFTYFTPEGVAKRLYAINASYTLIFFYNPECNACKEIKTRIQASDIITRNIRAGRLKLLAMYTDADELLWRNHLPENPIQWINGRDEQEYLWKNKVYDLRAIPTLYLLDAQKKVLLKDCSVDAIEQVLQ